MATKIDLSAAPYFDSYADHKNYYKPLFKPGVSVQTRELNELHSALQRQTEKFGSAIFKSGTIISGVNFIFHNNYPYVKLLDTQVDGTVVQPSQYLGYFVRNNNNLRGYVLNYADGFEASDPDLKTLYINYINSGDSGTDSAFTPGDSLTVYSSNVGVESIKVNNGGLSFSNADNLIITPAIAVNVSSGSFSNGDYIIQPSTGANLEIIEVDDVTLSGTDQVLLYVKPRDADLANALANSQMWTLSVDDEVIDSGNAVTGVIENIFGVNANGTIVTNGAGKVTSIIMSVKGSGYDYIPVATIHSPDNASGITNLSLEPRNYIAKLQVPTTPDAVGNGYAFSVGEGEIFQKGYFVDVQPQTIIVSKYTNTPNNISVGFETREEIIDFNRDPSLLDNVLGTENETAPGADRLKLTPSLVLADTNEAASNNEFFSIVEWSEGQPYKQNGSTIYSQIGDEMAQRTYEQSGDFVADRYYVATTVNDNFDDHGKFYKVVVDPGLAYIRGYRVNTTRNFNINVDKGLDTQVSNQMVSLNYGNYIRVNQVGGLFQFSTGDVISLYNQKKNFLSDTALVAAGNTSPVGQKIGEARIRSMVLENGIAGDRNTTYRLFLFDVRMNAGKKFEDIRSVYYDGVYKGIADTVLTADATTGAQVTRLEGTKNNRLLFPSGAESVKNSNNTYYIYRTIDQVLATSNNGTLTKSIAAIPDEIFPYSGDLSDAQMKELYVVPLSRDLVAYANLTGSAATTTGSNVITGSGTTFLTDLVSGDWVQVYANASAVDIKQVVSVTNNTSLRLDSNISFTAATAEVRRTFPKNVPVPFGSRSGLTANVDVNSKVLTLNYGMTFQGTTTANTALGVNIRRGATSSTSKTALRNRFVRIHMANNAAGLNGPWCVGVPDVFRLRNVYASETLPVDNTSRNITDEFYIDHNQNANYLDLSWLYKKERSPTKLTANTWLLVEFDYFTRSGAGYFDTVSYLNTSNAEQIALLDSTPLANLTTSAASLEVPEVYTYDDKYYDLLNTFDFRPAVVGTVTPTTGMVAPINPSATVSFGNTAEPSNDLKFPYPDSIMHTRLEQYMGRVDHVKISGAKGKIFVSKGQASSDPRKRHEPSPTNDSMALAKLSVPAYPNFVDVPTQDLIEIIDTRVLNEVGSKRLKKHQITSSISNVATESLQPKNYTMEDIGNLERRLKDVEYYVALTLLETSITSKIIPSSIDGTLNRFKFGFAVDDFKTDLYTDLANPQYNASKEADNEDGTEYRIAPPLFPWRVNNVLEVGNLPYVDEPLIEQPHATEETHPCVPNVTTTTVVTDAYYNVRQTDNTKHRATRHDTIVAANSAGVITMYFFNYDGYDNIKIYQSNATANVIVASSAASANQVQQLTQADKTWLSTNSHARQFYSGGSGDPSDAQYGNVINIHKPFTRGDGGDNVNWAGKITFNHNPAHGRNYTIKINNGDDSRLWKYLIKYPADTIGSVIDPCPPVTPPPPPPTPENPNPPVVPPPPPQPKTYVGSGGELSVTRNAVAGFLMTFGIKNIKGLKPNTKHTVYVDGVAVPEQWIPSSRIVNGAQLRGAIVDSTGTLSFSIITYGAGMFDKYGWAGYRDFTGGYNTPYNKTMTIEIKAPNSYIKYTLPPNLLASMGSSYHVSIAGQKFLSDRHTSVSLSGYKVQ